MAREPVPVDARMGSRVLDLVEKRLPASWSVMPIGGLGMLGTLKDPGQLTRDVDLVLLIVTDENLRIPSAEQVLGLARALSPTANLRRDQTSVAAILEDEVGPIKVEFIRGRNNQSGGYFITRRVLETAASHSARDGRVIKPPPEVLAFLKAWAATDQDKLVAAGKDQRGYHKARAAAFRADASKLRQHLIDRGHPPSNRIMGSLLGSCPPGRADRIAEVLRAAGWELG